MLYLYLALSLAVAAVFAHSILQGLLFFVGAFLGLLLLHVLVLALASLFVDKKNPNPKFFPFYRKLIILSVGPMLQAGRVRVELVGAEKLPAGGFLLVGNHRSDFDPITAMWALRKRGLTFVTKKENVDIPVGGRIIVGSGCLSLDRSDDKQGLMVIRQAVRRIRAGDAIGIYPEGTRSKTGELLPFRVGCFKAPVGQVPPGGAEGGELRAGGKELPPPQNHRPADGQGRPALRRDRGHGHRRGRESGQGDTD